MVTHSPYYFGDVPCPCMQVKVWVRQNDFIDVLMQLMVQHIPNFKDTAMFLYAFYIQYMVYHLAANIGIRSCRNICFKRFSLWILLSLVSLAKKNLVEFNLCIFVDDALYFGATQEILTGLEKFWPDFSNTLV